MAEIPSVNGRSFFKFVFFSSAGMSDIICFCLLGRKCFARTNNFYWTLSARWASLPKGEKLNSLICALFFSPFGRDGKARDGFLLIIFLLKTRPEYTIPKHPAYAETFRGILVVVQHVMVLQLLPQSAFKISMM